MLLGEGNLIDQPVGPRCVSDVSDAFGEDHVKDYSVTDLTSLLFNSLCNNLCNRITIAPRWQHDAAFSASGQGLFCLSNFTVATPNACGSGTIELVLLYPSDPGFEERTQASI